MLSIEAVAARIKRSVSQTRVLLRQDGPPPRYTEGRRHYYALEDVLFWRDGQSWYQARCATVAKHKRARR